MKVERMDIRDLVLKPELGVMVADRFALHKLCVCWCGRETVEPEGPGQQS